MIVLEVVLATLALLGHAALWIGFSNRLHATGVPRRIVTVATLLSRLVLLLLPLAYLRLYVEQPGYRLYEAFEPRNINLANGYLLLTWIVALVYYPQWLWNRIGRGHPRPLRSHERTSFDVAVRLGAPPAGGAVTRWLSNIPGNQLFQLDVAEKVLALPGLPPELDGLSIAHLSDLHFSGRVTARYFEEVVGRVNELQADLAVITGDICDKVPCIDWIGNTLGQIRSRHGNYYVLGNHDLRVRDVARLRSVLASAGWNDVGGMTRLVECNAGAVLLAGNELPWFRPAAEVEATGGDENGSRPLKILLSHSPDQYRWARQRGFDLMLAGHTHGGQICLPWCGPIVCPSWYGVKYAAGVFDEPPTVMHVSRGVSSLTTLRFNCPPELVKLVLVSDRSA